MKITESIEFSSKNESELRIALGKVLQQISFAINGNLDPATNLKVDTQDVTFSSANSDTQVRHSLGRTPVGYWPVSLSAAMTIYDGTVARNANFITLKSSATGSAKLFIF